MGQAEQAVGQGAVEKGFSSQAPGYLFSKAGLLILLGLLLLAAWNRLVVIAVTLGLVLSAAGVARLWSRLSLVGVTCQRTLSQTRAFPDEQVELKLKLSNRKLLPLPWLQADCEIPETLLPADNPPWREASRGFRYLSKAASLLWYTSISWRSRLLCRKRGYYALNPVMVSSGDIFGLYPRAANLTETQYVIVYPRLYSISHIDIPSLYPIGETQAERRIFEDPTRAIGVRDYTPNDSLRRIHWKASARRQTLQVKVYEPTTTLTVAVFLAVDTFQNHEDESDEVFELGISTAASVASYLTGKRSPVGLYVNTRLADTGEQARVLPGNGLGHLVRLLETLAKTTLGHSSQFDDFLMAQWPSLPWGTTLVLVIRRATPALPGLLARIKQAGYKALVLQIGEPQRGAGEYAAWHNIRSPGDLDDIRTGVGA